MMQLRKGVHVYTWDDQSVGRVERVVLDPVTKDVTHVVVRQGFLFTEDKLMPIEMIMSASDDRVVLRQDVGDLGKLPKFEEAHYVPSYFNEEDYPYYAEGAADPLYWYPPLGVAGYYGGPIGTPEPYLERIEQNIPDNTVAIKDGANVFSADGKHVGDVERVFIDSRSDRATHIVISQGLFFKERKLIPTAWLNIIGEDEVHLSVDSDYVDRLPAYHDDAERAR
jgi:uncharacterized protein YrrD